MQLNGAPCATEAILHGLFAIGDRKIAIFFSQSFQVFWTWKNARTVRKYMFTVLTFS